MSREVLIAVVLCSCAAVALADGRHIGGPLDFDGDPLGNIRLTDIPPEAGFGGGLPPATTPEPTTLGLLVLGGLALLARRRRK